MNEVSLSCCVTAAELGHRACMKEMWSHTPQVQHIYKNLIRGISIIFQCLHFCCGPSQVTVSALYVKISHTNSMLAFSYE